MMTIGSPRWSAYGTGALAVFQVVVALLLLVNREQAIRQFVEHGLAPTPAVARTSILGAVAMHLVLAVLCGVLVSALPRGRRATRILGTVLLAVIAVGGAAAMALPIQTWLSPVGIALALAALALIWLPTHAARRCTNGGQTCEMTPAGAPSGIAGWGWRRRSR